MLQYYGIRPIHPVKVIGTDLGSLDHALIVGMGPYPEVGLLKSYETTRLDH